MLKQSKIVGNKEKDEKASELHGGAVHLFVGEYTCMRLDSARVGSNETFNLKLPVKFHFTLGSDEGRSQVEIPSLIQQLLDNFVDIVVSHIKDRDMGVTLEEYVGQIYSTSAIGLMSLMYSELMVHNSLSTVKLKPANSMHEIFDDIVKTYYMDFVAEVQK